MSPAETALITDGFGGSRVRAADRLIGVWMSALNSPDSLSFAMRQRATGVDSIPPPSYTPRRRYITQMLTHAYQVYLTSCGADTESEICSR